MYALRLNETLDNIYHLLLALARTLEPEACYLDDLVNVLERARADEDIHTSYTLLPVLSCVACGGPTENAVPVAAAWRALHIAAHLFDSVQDQEVPPSPDPVTARALTIDVAMGLLALANLALHEVPESVGAQAKQTLIRGFQRAIVRAAGGQHLEFTHSHPPDLETYFHIVGLKSGEPFALAVQSGGLVAGASEETLARYRTFGYNVGVLIQLMDDWRDFVSDPGNGHAHSLPFVYAISVASPPFAEQLQLERTRKHREESAQRVREMVREVGGISYTVGEIFRHFERAVGALSVESDYILHEWIVNVMGRFSSRGSKP